MTLDINSMSYMVTDCQKVAAKEERQISNHMRVCVGIGEGVETIRGNASSEPILSEVASQIMMMGGYGFSLPDALTEVLSGFSINPGDRTELLVFAFFT
jgi:hypothetical protein